MPQGRELVIELPQEVRPLPEPLPQGGRPGFKIRGTKGWAWTPEQYLEEIPVLARCKMNFLMNCYLSLFDDKTGKNEWWRPLPESKRRAFEEIVRSCQKHGVAFCFCMNPNLRSERFIGRDPREIDALWRHYRWMQSLGVKWFSVSLDDIQRGIDAAMQADVVNDILRRLREKDPGAQMVFCPTFYWGDGTGDARTTAYNAALARRLHPDIYVFWTGDEVVTPRITRRAAESFKKILNHRVILWDNYPVNDGHPTMHLGPVVGRDADLGNVLDGYMVNPLCPQNRINRLPLLTCADYAYNPTAYDPARSIGQAIVHLAENDRQREALRHLTVAYPGMLIFGGGAGANPVRERFLRIAAKADSRAEAEKHLRDFDALVQRFAEAFPTQFPDAQKTLATDAAWLQEAFQKQYHDANHRGTEKP